ncbi:hypothetical protein [Bacillus sp. NEB1478]|uniref:hypothetical protein n=1 Tax=Bacillus sp. NEB1478 TaxID=3073816 RepID=UPI0028736E37|nr:hypothetical protein [Bacillus sp. NEB1478]WNB93433.1 hypothetical protein RGB74_07115 [Bacillus sp. NEB1478]
MNIFQVKSKPGNEERIAEFIKDNFVAIGWTETGSLKGADKETIRQKLVNLNYEGQSLRTNLGTINSFVNTMHKGDIVLVTEGDFVHIGILEEYNWEKKYIDIRCAHMRSVEWVAKAKKSELNGEVQALLRNGTSVTKFKHPFNVAELGRYLNFKNDGFQTQNSQLSEEGVPIVAEQYSEIADKTLKTLEGLLSSENEQIKLEAAKELLNFLKR